eukprot:Protomagalhaensia_sp_Gyna_25__807@NODE_1389_length_1886_cov_6_188955_g1118_i0_p1_GENE_NODE_1389_length_1886_cov_6_188955_g1118_i0NODE_1389_length_1886_cov_6_188955_g1118_i0_p1_ORF_typecomplete_len382_score39_41Lipase_3/PF01764_25/3_5e16DUF900/PF05990_12/0_012Abhydrolase_6/PF12697_7/0_1Abhydrolase_1/PF00561_20/0_18DUF2974/PF11187_8/0_2_NODE_1389_length_1886_cov_6_188955_g1118_i01871332
MVPPRIRNRELFTYLALYRALMLLYQLVPIPLYQCGDRGLALAAGSLLPGWDPVLVLTTTHLREPSFDSQDMLPFNRIAQLALLQKRCHFAVIVRGTVLRSEWFTNLLFRESPIPLLRHANVKATAAQGYLSVATRLLPVIESTIATAMNGSDCRLGDTTITIAGHSLGAAVGEVLALLLGDRMAGARVRVQGVFFAAPRVFNHEATRLYAKLVNGRSLIDLADPLHYVPCFGNNSRLGMARCGREHFMPSGAGSDHWASLPGFVPLDTGVKAIVESSRVTPTMENADLLDTVLNKTMQNAQNVEGFSLLPFLKSLVSPGVYDVLSRGIAQLLGPIKALRFLPSRAEFSAAHTYSFACALSTACHGLPWSDFRWWCDHLDR